MDSVVDVVSDPRAYDGKEVTIKGWASIACRSPKVETKLNLKMQKFHDWTLVDVVFEWAVARVAVTLIGPLSARRVLLAEDVLSLDVPRKSPWGESSSVNSLVIFDTADQDEQCVEIEMQSGDVIRVRANKISVQGDSECF